MPTPHTRLSTRFLGAVGLALLTGTAPASAQSTGIVVTVRDTVGDLEVEHPGDARDVPRRSMEIVHAVTYLETNPGSNFGTDFDVRGDDRPVGFTHAFDLPAGATIVGAVLQMRLRGGGAGGNDSLILDEGVRRWAACQAQQLALAQCVNGGAPRIVRAHVLGFAPVPTEVYDLTIDLSRAPVIFSNCPNAVCPPAPDALVDLLPDLEDGRLNVIVHDDTAVDASRLTVRLRLKE